MTTRASPFLSTSPGFSRVGHARRVPHSDGSGPRVPCRSARGGHAGDTRTQRPWPRPPRTSGRSSPPPKIRAAEARPSARFPLPGSSCRPPLNEDGRPIRPQDSRQKPQTTTYAASTIEKRKPNRNRSLLATMHGRVYSPLLGLTWAEWPGEGGARRNENLRPPGREACHHPVTLRKTHRTPTT